MDIDTSNLILDTSSGPAAAYSAAPREGGPGVLLLHAWWGLNDDFKTWCDDLAKAGFTVLAPDLRDGRVVDTVEDADALRGEFGPDRLAPVVEAALAELLARTGESSVSAVGASMGAAWAFWLAESDPEHVRSVVAYYGLTEAEWSQVKARVLHHFGDRDHLDPVEDAEAMHHVMTEAGIDATLEVYPGADHWFAEAHRPQYDAEAAGLAWRRTVEFLKRD